jgi:hypothetical protein
MSVDRGRPEPVGQDDRFVECALPTLSDHEISSRSGWRGARHRSRSARPKLASRNAKPECRCTSQSTTLLASALTGSGHRPRSDRCRELDRTCRMIPPITLEVKSLDLVAIACKTPELEPPSPCPHCCHRAMPSPVALGTVLPCIIYPRGGAVLGWQQSGVVKSPPLRKQGSARLRYTANHLRDRALTGHVADMSKSTLMTPSGPHPGSGRSCLRLGRQRLDRRANRPHNQPRPTKTCAGRPPAVGRTRAQVAPQFR